MKITVVAPRYPDNVWTDYTTLGDGIWEIKREQDDKGVVCSEKEVNKKINKLIRKYRQTSDTKGIQFTHDTVTIITRSNFLADKYNFGADYEVREICTSIGDGEWRVELWNNTDTPSCKLCGHFIGECSCPQQLDDNIVEDYDVNGLIDFCLNIGEQRVLRIEVDSYDAS